MFSEFGHSGSLRRPEWFHQFFFGFKGAIPVELFASEFWE
jgi:hypothetical protein